MLRPIRFGPYEPSVPRYEPARWKTIAAPVATAKGLTPRQLAHLDRHGILAEVRKSGLFELTREMLGERPVLITIDLVAELVWLELGALWHRLETHHMATLMSRLATELAAEVPAADEGTAVLARGLELARAYAGVLAALGEATPRPRDELVAAEMKRIAAGKQARSGILDREVDYGQFVEYDGRSMLGRYHRQRIWASLPLGRPTQQPGSLRPLDPHVTAALLVFRGLLRNARAGEAWRQLNGTISALVGGHTRVDPLPLVGAARQEFGDRITLARLARPARWRAFDRRLVKVADPYQGIELALVGRRRVADFRVLAQLAWPNVGTPSIPRIDPGGLDLAAALGSPRATRRLLDRLGRFPRFSEKLMSARLTHLPLPAEQTTRRVRSLYQAGRDVLACILRPPVRGGPLPRWSDAWLDRALSTALGSWLRMRNFPRAPRALENPAATGDLDLEPAPHVFARLAAMARAVHRSLTVAGISSDRLAPLAKLAGEVDRLCRIAARRLSGKSRLAGEHVGMREMLARWLTRPVHPPKDEANDELIFRAHDATGGWQEIRAGSRGCLLLHVALPVGDRRVVHAGAAYAYREGRRDPKTKGEPQLPGWLTRSPLMHVDSEEK